MCADRHWKLVYRWISAHITLLVEHTPISGSFMFLLYNQSSVSIRVIRGKRKNRPVYHTRSGYLMFNSASKREQRRVCSISAEREQNRRSQWLKSSSTKQLTCLLVYSFTCQLTTFILAVPIFTIITPDADGA